MLSIILLVWAHPRSLIFSSLGHLRLNFSNPLLGHDTNTGWYLLREKLPCDKFGVTLAILCSVLLQTVNRNGTELTLHLYVFFGVYTQSNRSWRTIYEGELLQSDIGVNMDHPFLYTGQLHWWLQNHTILLIFLRFMTCCVTLPRSFFRHENIRCTT